MAIYLKINDIDGSVTATGYQKCIEVYNYHCEANKAATQKTGSSSDRTTGALSFPAIRFTKPLDASSAELMDYFFNSKVIPEITFNHVTTGAKPQTYMQNTFKNVLLTRHAHHASEGEVIEEVAFTYDVTTKTVSPMNANHQPGTPKTVGYDTTKAKSM